MCGGEPLANITRLPGRYYAGVVFFLTIMALLTIIPVHRCILLIKHRLGKSVFTALLLLTLDSTEVNSGTQHSLFNALKFDHLNADNGLPMGAMTYGCTDSNGFIWVGAYNYLVKWNGHQCRTYSIPDSVISKNVGFTLDMEMVEDQQGMNWIAFSSAIGGFNYYTDSLEVYDIFREKHLAGNYFRLIGMSSDSTLVGYVEGPDSRFLIHTKSKKLSFVNEKLFNIHMRHYCIRNHKKAWVEVVKSKLTLSVFSKDSLCNRKSYFHDDKKVLTSKFKIAYQLNDSIVFIFSRNTLLRLNLHNTGDNSSNCKYLEFKQDLLDVKRYEQYLVVGTFSGTYFIDISTFSIVTSIQNDPLDPRSLITPLNHLSGLDRYGNIFIKDGYQGISYCNLSKIKFETILDPAFAGKMKTGSFVRGIAEDLQGNIWIGTMTNGAILLDSARNLIRIFKEDKEWPDRILSNGVSQVLCDTSGRIWIISSPLQFFDYRQNRFQSVPQANYGFTYMTQTHSGRLVLTTSSSQLFALNYGTEGYACELIYEDKSHDNYYSSVYEDENNNLWLSSDRGAEILKRDKSGKYSVYKTFDFLSVIKAYYPLTKKELLLATENGLWLVNTSDFRFKSFNKSNGLPDNYLYSILADTLGYLWVSSNRGLSRFRIDGDSLRQITNYTLADGLQSNEFNSFAGLKRKNGELWFGGIKGINIPHAKAYTRSRTKPFLHINELLINDEIVKADTSINFRKRITLDYDKVTFSLQFSATDLNNAAGCKVQYTLEGADNKWVTASNPGFLRYGNLNPGNYKLIFRAANSEGVWTENSRILYFTVLAPWYNTWWFKVVAFVLLLSIGYSIYRYRIYQLLKLQRIRNHIARDLHDDVGATLGSISIYSDIAMQQSPETARQLLSRIGHASRDMLEKMNDIVWAVNPKNDSFEQLVLRMKYFAALSLTPKDIQFEFVVDSTRLNSVVLNMEKRKNIFLIYKEAIHNIVKYADAQRVVITMEVKHFHLLIQIEDDGRGFNNKEHNAYNGNGLTNMNSRAGEIKATIEIDSVHGRGTCIKLTTPV